MIPTTAIARLRLAALLGLTLPACGGGDRAETPAPAPAESTEAAEQVDDSTKGVVTLSEEAFRAAGIAVELARPLARQGDVTVLPVPGQVEADPSRVALITPRVAGRLERLEATAGSRVAAGAIVARLQSAEHLAAQADLVQAARRAAALGGSADSSIARRTLDGARRRLLRLGVEAAALDRIERTGETEDLLPIRAPFAGSLVESLALPGAALAAGEPIFRLIDLSEVDVVASVPEAEMPYVSVGQRADVTPNAYPDARFAGRIERIKDELDPTTRTVAAVVHVANPRGILRPGMFAMVRVAVPLGRRTDPTSAGTAGVVIPESAILIQESERYVFIEIGPRKYRRQLVDAVSLDEVGTGTRRVIVRNGIAAGDRVVVAGAFILKSELAKAALGEEE